MRTMLIVAMILLGVAFLFLRQRRAQQAVEQERLERRASHSNSEWHAVAIKSPAAACDAAKKLEGERFLATQAPKLPLPGCDRQHCECRFQHYKDRRSGRDRRSPFASSGKAVATGSFEQERRNTSGRRADD